jgi:GTP cyclohydrolase I
MIALNLNSRYTTAETAMKKRFQPMWPNPPRPKFHNNFLPKDQDQLTTTTESVQVESIQPLTPRSQIIRDRILADNGRYWAGDNISAWLEPGDREQLIDEATQAFEQVLDTLVIDRATDPNSQGTARRLAKMYFNEIMSGRYDAAPDCTAFPNDSDQRYEGMLVVRSELRSMCSHHHQPVSGVAYIGIIAANKLIGLSKYSRIAQWCARRGTLQEELCNDIAREIMRVTSSKDVGVYIQAVHGCCENRGIMAHSSLTQTTVLSGVFRTDSGVKKEFMDNIKLQQEFAPR